MVSDLVTAVSGGSQRDSLVAIRDLLADQLTQSGSPREAAVVARELRETLRELQALGGVEVDDVDELASRRAERRSGA